LINFRFHLISLIAVFLALALGVVMGYGVLGEPTVDTLQGRVDEVEARADRIRAENDALRQENERLSTSMQSIDDFAVTSRLSGGAVPVAVRGLNQDHIAEFVRLARRGGAVVPGIIWLEEKWGLKNPDAITELASIIGTGATNRTAVRDAAARALATRLAAGPTPAGRQDLLTQLDDAGFLSVQEVDGLPFDSAAFDGRGGRVLAVGGTEASVPHERGTIPLARALVAVGIPVAVADSWQNVEGGEPRGAPLAGIRDDDELSSTVATLDAFDAVDGPLVAVLILGERGQGVIGHYGFGQGADGAVPEWWIV
jgi:hypothetical protein